MKFEVFIPDEFIEAIIKIEDPIAFSNKNTPYDDYYYASINSVCKMICDYYQKEKLFLKDLNKIYVKHLKMYKQRGDEQ